EPLADPAHKYVGEKSLPCGLPESCQFTNRPGFGALVPMAVFEGSRDLRYEIGTVIFDVRRRRWDEASILQDLADYGPIERRFIPGFQRSNDKVVCPVGKQNVCPLSHIHRENEAPVGEFVVPFQFNEFLRGPAVLEELYARNLELSQLLVGFSYGLKPIIDCEVTLRKPDRPTRQ